jgi:hypothetical protein
MAHATDRGIPQIDSYEKWKHALEKTGIAIGALSSFVAVRRYLRN